MKFKLKSSQKKFILRDHEHPDTIKEMHNMINSLESVGFKFKDVLLEDSEVDIVILKKTISNTPTIKINSIEELVDLQKKDVTLMV